MKLLVRIFLIYMIFSMASCHEGDRSGVQTNEPVKADAIAEEFTEPVVILLYPDSEKAALLRDSLGSGRYHELSDLNGHHFTQIRNLLTSSGIAFISSESTRFRFVSSEGAITGMDLSRLSSPWQVIVFDGSGAPELLAPAKAESRIRELFPVSPAPASAKYHRVTKTAATPVPEYAEKSSPEEIAAFNPGTPLIHKSTIRLLLPAGTKLPGLRNESSDYRMVTGYISPRHSFGLIFENDIFSYTDRYYTNGLVFKYTAPGLAVIPVSRLMLPPGHNTIVHASVSLHHAMFTPFTTKNPPLLDGDRPYASTLYLRYSQTQENAAAGMLLYSALDAGVIGDAALGKYLQKSVHATVPTNDEPLGWETQVRNDIILNYTAGVSKQLLQGRHAEAYVGGTAQAGTLYTNIGLGIDAIAGVFTPVLIPLPASYDELKRSPDKWQYGLRGGLEFRLIGYDATLQGGVLNRRNIYVLKPEEIERLVTSAHLGIFVRYRRLGVTISQYYLSREIAEGKHHFWGHIGLEYDW